MKNKKIVIILIIILLLIAPLILQLAKSQDTGLPSGYEKLGQNPEETIEQYKNKTLTSWDYLSKEWENILLKNKFIAKIDSFCKKIPGVFKILFNMEYSLSMTLLAIIFLWIFFIFESGSMIQKAFGINSIIAFLFGVGIAIILAQIKFLLLLAKLTGWLVFAKKEWWWNIIMVAIIILFFFFLYYFSGTLGKYLEARRKKKIEEEGELTFETIKKWWKGFKTGEK